MKDAISKMLEFRVLTLEHFTKYPQDVNNGNNLVYLCLDKVLNNLDTPEDFGDLLTITGNVWPYNKEVSLVETTKLTVAEVFLDLSNERRWWTEESEKFFGITAKELSDRHIRGTEGLIKAYGEMVSSTGPLDPVKNIALASKPNPDYDVYVRAEDCRSQVCPDTWLIANHRDRLLYQKVVCNVKELSESAQWVNTVVVFLTERLFNTTEHKLLSRQVLSRLAFDIEFFTAAVEFETGKVEPDFPLPISVGDYGYLNGLELVTQGDEEHPFKSDYSEEEERAFLYKFAFLCPDYDAGEIRFESMPGKSFLVAIETAIKEDIYVTQTELGLETNFPPRPYRHQIPVLLDVLEDIVAQSRVKNAKQPAEETPYNPEDSDGETTGEPMKFDKDNGNGRNLINLMGKRYAEEISSVQTHDLTAEIHEPGMAFVNPGDQGSFARSEPTTLGGGMNPMCLNRVFNNTPNAVSLETARAIATSFSASTHRPHTVTQVVGWIDSLNALRPGTLSNDYLQKKARGCSAGGFVKEFTEIVDCLIYLHRASKPDCGTLTNSWIHYDVPGKITYLGTLMDSVNSQFTIPYSGNCSPQIVKVVNACNASQQSTQHTVNQVLRLIDEINDIRPNTLTFAVVDKMTRGNDLTGFIEDLHVMVNKHTTRCRRTLARSTDMDAPELPVSIDGKIRLLKSLTDQIKGEVGPHLLEVESLLSDLRDDGEDVDLIVVDWGVNLNPDYTNLNLEAYIEGLNNFRDFLFINYINPRLNEEAVVFRVMELLKGRLIEIYGLLYGEGKTELSPFDGHSSRVKSNNALLEFDGLTVMYLMSLLSRAPAEHRWMNWIKDNDGLTALLNELDVRTRWVLEGLETSDLWISYTGDNAVAELKESMNRYIE